MTRILLVVHIFGAALVIGGVVANAVWMTGAIATRDSKTVAFALRAMRRVNLWTLHLGAALILISGVWLAVGGPTPFKLGSNPWLLYSILLFFVVLSLLMGAQAPIAKKLDVLADSEGADFARILATVAGRWNLLSLISIALLVAILAFMIFKPGQ
jgi:uncharacterized membrane protein